MSTSSVKQYAPITPKYEFNQPRAVNQPPVKNVGKTGFYINLSGTFFRFPAAVTIPNGKVVEGRRLTPKRGLSAPILKQWRSKYRSNPQQWRDKKAKLKREKANAR